MFVGFHCRGPACLLLKSFLSAFFWFVSGAIVYRIPFHFLIFLQIAYKKIINFCILMLYPLTMRNSLTSSRSRCVSFLEFFESSGNKDIFFLISLPFISSHCLIAMTRTSSKMLSKNGKKNIASSHLCRIETKTNKNIQRKKIRFVVIKGGGGDGGIG